MPTVDNENKPTLSSKSEILAELLPPEGNLKVGYRIFELVEKVMEFKNFLGLPQKWNRNYELGRNKHWKQETNKTPLITANILFSHRQRTVNTLTDNAPTFNIRQVGELSPEKEDLLQTLVRTAEHWWQEQEQQHVLEESVINGETYGCAIEKCIFNPDIEYGIGEVETIVVDPFYFGMYPTKETKIQKCEAVFHYWPMTVREARRKWPEVAEHITSDKQLLDELSDTRLEVTGPLKASKGYFTTISNVIKRVISTAGKAGGDDDDEVLVVEAWVKDYTRERNGDKEYDKYPGNIRCVTTLNGGKIVCSDRPNPSINPTLPEKLVSQTYLYDKFPFSFNHSVTDTVSPWGVSDIEQLEGLQIEVDKTLSQFTLIKDRLSRIKIINPKDSGVHNSEFTNAPGIINPSNSMVAQAIKYMDLPNVPFQDLIAALGIYKDFFFLVAGTFELEQAQTPGREVIAYKAIATLLERAATMMRGKIRNYSKMIRERGRMYISNMMNWYTEDRWISYEEDGEKISQQIKGPDMIVPAKLGVVSGSTLPVSRIAEREEAASLFQQGAIDAQELLKKLDWPNWREVVRRLQTGPLADLYAKLEKMGFPPAFVEALGQLQSMDEKDFGRALQKGEIPTAQELLTMPEQQGPPITEQAETNLKMAQVQKIMAEIALLTEQTNTEKVKQVMHMAGIQFDDEKLAMERAQLVKEMEKADHEMLTGNLDRLQGGNGGEEKGKSKGKKAQGPFRERGMESDNLPR